MPESVNQLSHSLFQLIELQHCLHPILTVLYKERKLPKELDPLNPTPPKLRFVSPPEERSYGVHTSLVAVISLLINLALRFYPASE